MSEDYNNNQKNNDAKEVSQYRKYRNVSGIVAWCIAVAVMIFLLIAFVHCPCLITNECTCDHCKNQTVEITGEDTPMGNVEIVEIDGVPFMKANGDLTEKSEAEISAMAASMGPNQLPININSVPFAETPYDAVNFLIENPSGSDKNILVEVYTLRNGVTADTYASEADLGDLIYITDGIMPPSSHIECDGPDGTSLPGYDYLITDLGSGEYNCVALFKGYDSSEDFNYIGTMPVFLTLTIGEEA